jgi:hypothetical protein
MPTGRQVNRDFPDLLFSQKFILIPAKKYFVGHLGHWIYCPVLYKALLWRVWGGYMMG